MNEMQVFNNEEFGSVRTMELGGDVWFVGSDVAKLLGYLNVSKALSDHCKGVTKRYIPRPQGNGTLEVNIIPERDVYRLIMRSKLPQAEKFEEWVVSDVLPTIRKTGGYLPQIPKTYADALRAYATEIESHEATKKELEIAAPKAEFYDTVTNTDTLFDFATVAKTLDMGLGRNKLMMFLRNKKILMSNNKPYQEYVDRGYFKEIISHHEEKGIEVASTTTKVKSKGIDFIRKLILKERTVLQ